MTPDRILQASMLDIIFENRNKNYGAYSLRKYYSNRITIAIVIALLIAAIFSWLILADRSGSYASTIHSNDEYKIQEYIIPKDLPKPATPEPPAKPLAILVPVAPVSPAPPEEITSRILLVNEPVTPPSLKPIEHTPVTNIDPVGPVIKGIIPVIPITGGGGKKPSEGTSDNDPVNSNMVTEQAMFPGGEVALIRFLKQNLRAPDGMEAGEMKRVVVRFVVNKDGVIDRVQVSSSAGKNFDEEVLRVMRLMPKWKPARQQDRTVPVYFSLPVVFTVNEE